MIFGLMAFTEMYFISNQVVDVKNKGQTFLFFSSIHLAMYLELVKV